jgi:hypothetical protein
MFAHGLFPNSACAAPYVTYHSVNYKNGGGGSHIMAGGCLYVRVYVGPYMKYAPIYAPAAIFVVTKTIRMAFPSN